MAAALARLVVLALAACVTALGAPQAVARGDTPTLSEVRLAELPAEARDVYAHILSGGPFRYDRDGVVFGNRERLLPSRPRGYYHEYTVAARGERSRGARRIVCGGPTTAPEVCYYTDDHYQSFRRIRA